MTPTTRFAAVSVVALASAFALTGCVLVPVGPTASEDHNVGDDVHGLRLETSADVEVRLGDEPGLELRGPQGALDLITVEEDDGVLVIGNTGPGYMIREVRATLVVTSLDSIEIEGAGDVEAEFSPAESVTVSIEGSGDVEADGIDATDVEVEIRGAGDVELDGTAENASYTISGTGDIDASGLEVTDAVAEINGTGDITVYATGTADARISGAGDIRILGGAEVSQRVDGLGNVREG
jgi:hypothetical protein